MATRYLYQFCIVIFLLFYKVTDAAWTLTGSLEFGVANEEFVLTCLPDKSGTAISWRRSGITIASIDNTNSCVIQNRDSQYRYTCEPGPVYKLTIPANVMTNSQNNIVWRCESQFGGTGNDAEYTLKVAVPVRGVSVQGDSGYPAVNVIYENTPKTFTCITNGCRPKANITVTTTGVTMGQRTERQDTQSDGLIVTTVFQTITATRGGGSLKTFQCSAVNIQERQPVTSQKLTLDVYYIPSVEPTLSGYTTGTVLYEGDNTLTITCQQSGGNPLSVITWSCNGQTGTPNSSGTVASSYVQLTINRNLNGKTCSCTVRHPFITTYTRTKSVTFSVYYPPTTPTLQTSGTSFPWVENTRGVLRCTTFPGNPPQTTYEWLQNSQIINGQTTDTYTLPILSNVHNGLRIQCRVSNMYTVQRPPAKVSNICTLDVQYPPAVTVDLQNTTENATNVVFTCNADGFPAIYTYRGWSQYIGNTLVRPYRDFTGMLTENNRKIAIPKVTFEDTGKYYCDVENGIQGRQSAVLQRGSSYFDVRVSAKFDPKEEAHKPGELHERLTINIKFYSHPPALMNDIKWINKTTTRNTLTDSDSISIKLMSTAIQRLVYGKIVTLTGQSAMLTIASLQSFHLGYYQLQIQNGGDLSSSFDFQIITSVPPEPPSEFSLTENGTKSVKVTWKRGYNGGHIQTFVVRYTNTDSSETKETTIEDNNRSSYYTIEIDGLKPSTTYHFWIYSTNNKGNSTLSRTLIVHTLKVSLSESICGNGPVIATSVLIVILCVVIIVLAIIIWRRGHCISFKDNGSKRDENSEVGPNYEGVSQNYQEKNLYEGIQTDQENQSESREVGTYESLESKDVETKNTYESLQTTDRPDSGWISMELYENTKITL